MRYAWIAVMISIVVLQVGCSSAPKSESVRESRGADAATAVERFKRADPSLSESFFDKSVGWAVFPKVGKGGIGLGGAYGRGVLYEGGKIVGYTDLTQASIGFQLGGQVYSEIIFFENESVLNKFKSGTMEFSAQASAVAASADASRKANFDNGIAVFTLSGKGLMYEASIGGQKFDYTPEQ